MFKSKRRKELEKKEEELYRLKHRINEMKYWCSADAPVIGFSMVWLETRQIDISRFREELRNGDYTFDKFKEKVLKNKVCL